MIRINQALLNRATFIKVGGYYSYLFRFDNCSAYVFDKEHSIDYYVLSNNYEVLSTGSTTDVSEVENMLLNLKGD